MQEIDVIKAMEAHAEEFDLELTSIGQMAVRNRNAYERVKRGTAHRDTESRIVEWISADRAARLGGVSA